ncbi:hypothetical protein Nmel_013528 [Mimus melanotis]
MDMQTYSSQGDLRKRMKAVLEKELAVCMRTISTVQSCDRGVSCQRSQQSHFLSTGLCLSGFNTSVLLGQNSSSSSTHLLSGSSTTCEHHFRTLFSTKPFAPKAASQTLPTLCVSSACSPAWVAAEGIGALPGSAAISARQDAAGNVWPPLHDHLLKPGLLWQESNTNFPKVISSNSSRTQAQKF